MRLVAYYVLNLGFFLYGLARFVGSGFGVAQVMGWSDNEIGREVVGALEGGYAGLNAGAIVSLPMEGYLWWTFIMGIVLTLGSLLAFFKARFGYVLMGSYFVLFAAMFVNYQEINTKIVHLAVGLGLFMVMLLLGRRKD